MTVCSFPRCRVQGILSDFLCEHDEWRKLSRCEEEADADQLRPAQFLSATGHEVQMIQSVHVSTHTCSGLTLGCLSPSVRNNSAVESARALLVCSSKSRRYREAFLPSPTRPDDVCGRRCAGTLLLQRSADGKRRFFNDVLALASMSLESLKTLLPPSSLAMNP